MKRGDLVTIAMSGDYGKPRPALVIQSDVFALLPSVTVLPLTGSLSDTPLLRIPIDPTERNGLSKPSQIMVDKSMTVPRTKVGSAMGSVEPAILAAASRALAVFLDLVA